MSTHNGIMEAIAEAIEPGEEAGDGARILEDYPDLFWMDLSDEEIEALTTD